jgi:hypothetical protein
VKTHDGGCSLRDVSQSLFGVCGSAELRYEEVDTGEKSVWVDEGGEGVEVGGLAVRQGGTAVDTSQARASEMRLTSESSCINVLHFFGDMERFLSISSPAGSRRMGLKSFMALARIEQSGSWFLDNCDPCAAERGGRVGVDLDPCAAELSWSGYILGGESLERSLGLARGPGKLRKLHQGPGSPFLSSLHPSSPRQKALIACPLCPESIHDDALDTSPPRHSFRSPLKMASSTAGKASAASAASAFNILNDRLMSAGKVQHTDLANRGRITKGGSANPILRAQSSSSLYTGTTLAAPALNPDKEIAPETLGKGWFDMQPMKLDSKMKQEIRMIQMRNYVDPKRFYKNPDKIGKVLHTGTVIEGAHEYKSSRLTKKERKTSIVEEILADRQIKDYSKRKFLEIQSERAKTVKAFRNKPTKKGKLKAQKAKKVHKLF